MTNEESLQQFHCQKLQKTKFILIMALHKNCIKMKNQNNSARVRFL